eukprot:COSAG05_NODE_515_length_9075_cov_121.644719_8_plen_316_part_00
MLTAVHIGERWRRTGAETVGDVSRCSGRGRGQEGARLAGRRPEARFVLTDQARVAGVGGLRNIAGVTRGAETVGDVSRCSGRGRGQDGARLAGRRPEARFVLTDRARGAGVGGVQDGAGVTRGAETVGDVSRCSGRGRGQDGARVAGRRPDTSLVLTDRARGAGVGGVQDGASVPGSALAVGDGICAFRKRRGIGGARLAGRGPGSGVVVANRAERALGCWRRREVRADTCPSVGTGGSLGRASHALDVASRSVGHHAVEGALLGLSRHELGAARHRCREGALCVGHGREEQEDARLHHGRESLSSRRVRVERLA